MMTKLVYLRIYGSLTAKFPYPAPLERGGDREIEREDDIMGFTYDEFIKKYCEQFSIPVDYINRRPDKEGENAGKPIAFVYVDDRAICYKGESAEMLVSEILNFKPYWQK